MGEHLKILSRNYGAKGKEPVKSLTVFSPLKRDALKYRGVGTMCLVTCDTE